MSAGGRMMAMGMLVAAVLPAGAAENGRRLEVFDGTRAVPVVVVRGAPRDRGRALGRLIGPEVRAVAERVMAAAREEDPERYAEGVLDAAWRSTAPHIAARWQEELAGLAEGADVPVAELRRLHMIPVVSDYGCSGAALWGDATADGRLYVFRNLDFSMGWHLQDYPVIIVEIPDVGLPHVNLSFAGFIGVQTGMNAAGTALAEMGDSPGDDYPFDLNGAPFITLFSDMLHDGTDLEAALGVLRGARRIKKYHYIVANGRDRRGVKLRAHAPDLVEWGDNDPADEVSPHVFRHIVYNAEDRDPAAVEHMRKTYGRYDAAAVIDLARAVPIPGANLLAVVYDTEDLVCHFAYAAGDREAYEREFTRLDLRELFGKP